MSGYGCGCGKRLVLVERLDEVEGASTFRLACLSCGYTSRPVVVAGSLDPVMLAAIPGLIDQLEALERGSASGGRAVVEQRRRPAAGLGAQAPVPQSNAAD